MADVKSVRRTARNRNVTEKSLLRVEEAADRLSLGRSKTYALIQEGQLPSIRIGRSVRVPVVELDRWIRERTRAVDPEPTAA
jgi:excisionase family DNA binding protein